MTTTENPSPTRRVHSARRYDSIPDLINISYNSIIEERIEFNFFGNYNQVFCVLIFIPDLLFNHLIDIERCHNPLKDQTTIIKKKRDR